MANGCTVTTKMLFDDEQNFGPYAINNWHFSYNALTGDVEDCALQGRLAIIAFWASTAGTIDPFSSYLSNQLTGQVECSYVDWEDSTNTSIPQADFTVSPLTAALAYPNEVAVCATFKCDSYGGHRRQSFYNRVYLGPWASGVGTISNNTACRPNSTFRSNLALAYGSFQASLNIPGPDISHHAVYSPKNDSSSIVTSGWVDDAFDIQRRRGIDPTTKTAFTIA